MIQHEANAYITQIEKDSLDITIVGHRLVKENGKNILNISILNDSVAFSRMRLKKHDALQKDIELRWHYTKPASTNDAALKYLQAEIDQLKNELHTLTALREKKEDVKKP